MQKASQRLRLLKALQSGWWRSMPFLIRRMGGFRLSGRIYELRRQGHKIEHKQATVNGKVRSWYRLA